MAQLWGANLLAAQLQGTWLFYAELQGANLYKAQLQGADLEEAQLQGADLRQAQLWRATSEDQSVNLALTDLREADFRTPLTNKQQAELAQILASIPDSEARRLAEERLQGVLKPGRLKPKLAFTANSPVLADAPPAPPLAALLDWLISEPKPAYNEALADYLIGELAPLDPAVADSIATRVLDSVTDQPVHSIDLAIGCRLLANRKLGVNQSLIDNVIEWLKDEQFTCPVAPATAKKTN